MLAVRASMREHAQQADLAACVVESLVRQLGMEESIFRCVEVVELGVGLIEQPDFP